MLGSVVPFRKKMIVNIIFVFTLFEGQLLVRNVPKRKGTLVHCTINAKNPNTTTVKQNTFKEAEEILSAVIKRTCFRCSKLLQPHKKNISVCVLFVFIVKILITYCPHRLNINIIIYIKYLQMPKTLCRTSYIKFVKLIGVT